MNRHLRVGLGIFLFVLILTQFLAFQQYRIQKVEQSKQLENEINTVSRRLKETINHCVTATKTLAFIVEQYGFPDDFEILARDILSSSTYLDALELTEQGVITHVFPYEEYKSVLGLDVLNYEQESAEARKAMEMKKIFFAGPLKLNGGEMAIIGRHPMFVGNQFQGFSMGIIKLQTLIDAVEINPQQNGDFSYQLSKINPVTGKEEFFLTDSLNFTQENALSSQISDGEWMLHISANSGLNVYQEPLIFSVFGLFLAVISGLFSTYWAKQPDKLNKLVRQRTAELQNEKDLLDSIINSLPGMIFLFNKEGKFIRWNHTMEVLSGKNANEINDRTPLDFFEEDFSEEVNQAILETFENGSAELETTVELPDDSRIPIYFYARKIKLGNEEYLLGIGLDVSETKKAKEAALAASRDREITLNRISDGVVSFDADWNFIFVNEAAEAFMPVDKDLAIGRNIADMGQDVASTPFWEVMKHSVETMTEQEIEDYYEPLDRWFFVKVYPSGNGITVFFKDVTKIKKIEQETMKMIGRELHDNVVQVLTGAGMFLDIGVKKIGESNEDLERVSHMLKKGIDEIRMLSHDLISPFTRGTTLEESVREIFQQAAEASDFKVAFSFKEFNEELLSDKLKTTTFRVIQEQCNNILKYASPDHVNVKLSIDNDSFCVKIKDDGNGFDPNEETDGIGFINIRSRIALFNGKMSVTSSKGNGCEINVFFPMPEQVMV